MLLEGFLAGSRGGRWRRGAGRRMRIRSVGISPGWETGRRSTATRWPMSDARDWAVRDYKRHLKAVERWKPASVNLALAALDSFYTQLGLGRPIVRREELSKSAPREITVEEQRRLLRIAEGARRGIGRSWWCCSTRACGWRSSSRSTSTM